MQRNYPGTDGIVTATGMDPQMMPVLQQVGMVIGHVGYFKPKSVAGTMPDYLTHWALGAALSGEICLPCTAANMAYKKVILKRDSLKLKIRTEDNYFLHLQKLRLQSVATDSDRLFRPNQFLSFHESKIPLGGLRWKHYYSGSKTVFHSGTAFLSVHLDCTFIRFLFTRNTAGVTLGDCRKNVFRLSAYSQIYFPL